LPTAALVATELILSKRLLALTPLSAKRPKSNFVLVTFDALNAEDMSLYGRAFLTTPNIDAFARKGTVFTNFYSASDFTNPCVASILTAAYPSDHHIYQMKGQLRSRYSESNLTHAMRSAGFATGAVYSNPYAYYFARTLENKFDILPEPVFQQGGLQQLWNATTLPHQHSGIGSRMDEYLDLIGVWNYLGRLPDNLAERFRAAASFDLARQVMARLPEGFFLWVHVMTPHGPYLPDVTDLGRFSDPNTDIYRLKGAVSWKPHYALNLQSKVDVHRRRYDEFIATADRAFGAFMSDLENTGKLQNTTIIVSADHGESFRHCTRI